MLSRSGYEKLWQVNDVSRGWLGLAWLAMFFSELPPLLESSLLLFSLHTASRLSLTVVSRLTTGSS